MRLCYYNSINASTTIDCDTRIKKVINNMAQNMRKEKKGGCNFIEAIHEFMVLSAN